MYFYSRSTNGFYTPEIHGDAIPLDCIEVSDKQHADLMAAQSAGLSIQGGEGGVPVAVPPPARSGHELTANQIRRIESAITPRRLREAVLTPQGAAWLKAQDDQIAALRAQLTS